MVSLEETIEAHGHPNILATHKSTLEVTKESSLTLGGDCIIGVGANKGARDLSEGLKQLLNTKDSRIELTIEVGGLQEVIRGRGHSRMSFENPICMVLRRSSYVCGRTVMIQADKAAASLSRDLVSLLQIGNDVVKLTLEVSA